MNRAFVPILLSGAGLLALGCASKPPRELNDARAAYQRAASAPGAAHAPADLHEARQALADAEAKFKDEGHEPEARDLAYVAQRKAVSALARGNEAQSLAQKQTAEADLQRVKEQQTAALQNQLESTKGSLAEERRARSDALAKIADLQSKETERGLMLTLSGGVLFATGKSQLLPRAQARLGEIANVLKEDKRPITIVGHTDTKGSDESNQKLSEERADAVRKYLITRGLDASRVKAVGMGENQPIADNSTPDGRANNRRVEIILEKNQQ